MAITTAEICRTKQKFYCVRGWNFPKILLKNLLIICEQIYDESFNRVVFNYVQLNNYGQIRKEICKGSRDVYRTREIR